jgi:hypothetical protein
MNSKITILIPLFLILAIKAFGQDYKKEIETQFLYYNNLIIKKDFDKSMDYLPEEFFAIVPKDQMILVMEKTFSNPEMEFELESPIIKDIAAVEKIGDKFYAFLQYSSQMKMKFLNDDEPEETEAKQKQRTNMIKGLMEHTYGAGNVKFDEKTETFTIIAHKQAYAISANGESDWKFLVIEKKQKFILDKLLPMQLVEKI